MRESQRDPNTPEWIVEIVERHMRGVKLTSRRSRYRSTFISLANEINMETSQRVASLRAAIRQYGQHKGGCSARLMHDVSGAVIPLGGPCTCGLAQVDSDADASE